MSLRDPHRRIVAAAGQRGVTLVELMVGIVVGLLAILVISQVLLNSESQKRTTTSGADAQVNGVLSLYTMQRDIQTAGYGFTSSPSIIGCPISAQFGGATPTGFATTLAPVVITPQASRPAGSIGDSVRILASSKTSYSVPTRVIPPGYAAGGAVVPVSAAMGYVLGDLALAAIDGVNPCWVFEVTGAPTSMAVPTSSGAWSAPTQAYIDGNVLVNLGQLVDDRYEVNTVNNVPTLQLFSFDSTNPNTPKTVNIQSDIVNLRAFYGRDAVNTPGVTVSAYDQTTPATNADWLRVLSVRLIIASRSGQYEKTQVTPANPTWDVGASPATSGAAACGASQCLTIDVGAGVAGDVPAKHYRYKIFETIVPLRNMLWSS